MFPKTHHHSELFFDQHHQVKVSACPLSVIYDQTTEKQIASLLISKRYHGNKFHNLFEKFLVAELIIVP